MILPPILPIIVVLFLYCNIIIFTFYTETCGGKFFECKMNGTNDCLDTNFVCDGDWDCDDGEDERKELHTDNPICKSLRATCTPEEFQCQNGQCIDETKHCDKRTDCTDASDEMDGDCGKCRFKKTLSIGSPTNVKLRETYKSNNDLSFLQT